MKNPVKYNFRAYYYRASKTLKKPWYEKKEKQQDEKFLNKETLVILSDMMKRKIARS